MRIIQKLLNKTNTVIVKDIVITLTFMFRVLDEVDVSTVKARFIHKAWVFNWKTELLHLAIKTF